MNDAGIIAGLEVISVVKASVVREDTLLLPRTLHGRDLLRGRAGGTSEDVKMGIRSDSN